MATRHSVNILVVFCKSAHKNFVFFHPSIFWIFLERNANQWQRLEFEIVSLSRHCEIKHEKAVLGADGLEKDKFRE